MGLCGRQLKLAGDLARLRARREPGRIRSANLVSIKAPTRETRIGLDNCDAADASRAGAAIAKMNRDYIVRLAGHDPRRQRLTDRAASELQLDQIDIGFAAFLSFLVILRRDAQLLRRVRTDQSDVVPGDFRQRLWQLLQPAIVREAAVVDGWIGAEDEFEGAGGWGLRA